MELMRNSLAGAYLRKTKEAAENLFDSQRLTKVGLTGFEPATTCTPCKEGVA